MEQGRHNTGLILGQDASIPRHIVDIHRVFRPVLKGKTTVNPLVSKLSTVPQETSSASENVRGDASGQRETLECKFLILLDFLNRLTL